MNTVNTFSERIEDYEVMNLLGRGGFASVFYRAKCRKTGLDVAIKMTIFNGMTSHLTQDSGIQTMLSRRDSAFSDNGMHQVNPEIYSRCANSDCYPTNSCNYTHPHSNHSVDHLMTKKQQLPMIKPTCNLSCGKQQEQISVFSNTSSNNHCYNGNQGVNVLSVCSQKCGHPSDPGEGNQILTSISNCSNQYQCPNQYNHVNMPGHHILQENIIENRHYSNSSLAQKSDTVLKKNKLMQLCSYRLLPTRNQTKNAILTILEGGEVCVEFLKKRGSLKKEMVCEVCRISPDGQRIALYEPQNGKGVAPGDTPPDLPSQGTDQIFNFGNLPEKHWKKYTYAYTFVELVRAKTPKVTYYTDKAKCLLMENLLDFEACFYEGGKVTQSTNEGITVIDSKGSRINLQSTDQCRDLPSGLEMLWTHAIEARNHCIALEKTLAKLPGQCNFPIFVGRRPSSAPPLGKENQSHTVMPSFTTTLTSITPSSMNIPKEKKVVISGIGIATQLSSGEIRVRFYDGSTLSVDGKHNVQYQYPDGKTVSYKDSENIPRQIMEKMQHMPKILKQLMPTQVGNYRTNPIR